MTADPIDGRSFEPVLCEDGGSDPFKAESWLKDWAVIGGGISIGVGGELNPFRFARLDLPARAMADADYLEDALLHDLRHTLGLAFAVRVVVSTRAGAMMRSALKEMGIDQ